MALIDDAIAMQTTQFPGGPLPRPTPAPTPVSEWNPAFIGPPQRAQLPEYQQAIYGLLNRPASYALGPQQGQNVAAILAALAPWIAGAGALKYSLSRPDRPLNSALIQQLGIPEMTGLGPEGPILKGVPQIPRQAANEIGIPAYRAPSYTAGPSMRGPTPGGGFVGGGPGGGGTRWMRLPEED